MNKKLKVLVLFGSPHKNGNTAKFLKLFLNSLPERELFTVDAYKENITPCIDCKMCKTSEKCKFDDMHNINMMLNICDVIIVASPVYNAGFPAPLKAIFDRFQRYYNAKFTLKIDFPIKKRKKAVLILTQGSSESSFEKNITCMLGPVMRLVNAYPLYSLTALNTDCENFDIDNFYIKSENEVKNIISNLYN